MSTFYQFASESPWLTFFLVYLVGHLVVNLILRMWSRLMRAVMVSSQGWPPPHIDADGDWKPEEKKD